jgi:CheY-like chemotaxis protein
MKTVLIVEEDSDYPNPRMFSKILTKRGGLAVKHTENVEEVMQIAANGEADLILMKVSLSNTPCIRANLLTALRLLNCSKLTHKRPRCRLFW